MKKSIYFVFGAYKSLKSLFDPSVEGNPYIGFNNSGRRKTNQFVSRRKLFFRV